MDFFEIPTKSDPGTYFAKRVYFPWDHIKPLGAEDRIRKQLKGRPQGGRMSPRIAPEFHTPRTEGKQRIAFWTGKIRHSARTPINLACPLNRDDVVFFMLVSITCSALSLSVDHAVPVKSSTYRGTSLKVLLPGGLTPPIIFPVQIGRVGGLRSI